jgi:hypothetical protein
MLTTQVQPKQRHAAAGDLKQLCSTGDLKQRCSAGDLKAVLLVA